MDLAERLRMFDKLNRKANGYSMDLAERLRMLDKLNRKANKFLKHATPKDFELMFSSCPRLNSTRLFEESEKN